MASFSTVSRDRSLNNDSTAANGTESSAWSSSLLNQVERVIAPIQTPMTRGNSGDGPVERGVDGTGTSANATFAVLKTTAIQQALGHPLYYARVLMQMGYEPMDPFRGRTLFGKEAMFYPNVFRYLKFIYNKDGFFGLYRGYGCALAAKMVSLYATTKVNEILGPVDPVVPDDPNEASWNTCIKKTLREVRCQSFGILLSHPFQVMALRSMAQFIGRESDYSSYNIVQNFHQIYREEGLGGFFAGLVPRWLLEIATIVISNVLIHMLKSQLPSQKEMVPLYEYMAALFAQTATYPFSVVTTVTAINGSRLAAARLHQTMPYTNWQDVYRRLGQADQLKRGSGLFNRIAPISYSMQTPRLTISKP